MTTPSSQKAIQLHSKPIRPDLNLEKWSLWQPAKSHDKMRSKTLRREIELPDGATMMATVEVGFTQKGVLTTEDQKVLYALIKIWEEEGKPQEQTYYSIRRLAKILNKRWGTNVIDATSQSLVRLRVTPFIWTNSYYDSITKEHIESLDTFNILSDLKIIQKNKAGNHTKAFGFFRFDDFILKNLLNNYTKPILLDVVLGFKSEIAQLIYTHLDLVMARRRVYERKTKELFSIDLDLDGKSYKNTSSRVQKLKPALRELQGVRLSTGVITLATLEKTKDGKDFKIVIRKGTVRDMQHDNEPPEKPQVHSEPTEHERPSDHHAKELVQYFHHLFHHDDHHTPSIKAIGQAVTLLAQHGYDAARFIVDFSHKTAQETNYAPQTFGGILQYTSRALEAYELEKKRAEEQAIHQSVRSEQELKDQYDQFIRREVDRLKDTIPQCELQRLEEEAREYVRATTPQNLRSWGKDNSLVEMGALIHLTWMLAERLQLPIFEIWCSQMTSMQ